MKARRKLFGCLVVVAGAFTSSVFGAHDQQAPVFRAGVDLVTLDVTVVDRSGRPIPGLAPEDFIVALEGINASVKTLDYRTLGAAPDAAAGATNAAARVAPARNIVFLFDDLSYTPRPGKAVTVGIGRAISELDPRDKVGLLVSSRQSRPLPPTTDRQALLNALKTVQPRQEDTAPYFVTAREAAQIERGLEQKLLMEVATRECTELAQPLTSCFRQVQEAARRTAVIVQRTMETQVEAINGALALMKTLPEPRVLVIVSNGMAADPDNDLPKQLEAVGAAAAEAGVQLYALAETGDASDARDTTSERASARRRNSEFLTSGVQTFASAAGGEAFKVIGTADRFLQRILFETSGQYRLGVEAPPLPDTRRFLKTKVTVRRDGATVRVLPRAINPASRKTR